MPIQKLFCVTNWKSYALVEACTHEEAIINTYEDRFIKIDDSDLTEDTVTHAMCCEYEGRLGNVLESCQSDVDRVLIMNTRPETHHYQLR